ncbi:MAG: Mrp/NBP35 family ATP-binding protein [Desulfobacteraceae bacterium]
MIHENVEKAKKQGGGCPSQASQEDKQKKQEQMIRNNLSRIKNKLVVLSGKGGVGKSSVSVNLAACLAAKGFKTGLMDVDLHGPSIGHMLGMNDLLDMSENQMLLPKRVSENFTAVSIQGLMQDRDQAVIWRGPAKTGMIQQFVGSVEWGDLDFLIIDAPPGTGDEPISVVQTIKDAKGIIVTTPQEVALADIRKSISFCNTVKMDIVGIIENMSSYRCPHCNEPVDLFKTGGGKATAEKSGVNFLGAIPFDTEVVRSGDSGEPLMLNKSDSQFAEAFNTIVDNITSRL